jgi:hypothetical protein
MYILYIRRSIFILKIVPAGFRLSAACLMPGKKDIDPRPLPAKTH